MNASVFVTEYGCSTHLDDQLLVGIVEQQDRQRTSSTFWIWKENAAHGVLIIRFGATVPSSAC
jgi:hypothetical protein